MFAQLVLVSFLFVAQVSCGTQDGAIRVSVIRNHVPPVDTQFLAFTYNESDPKGLIFATSSDGDVWSEWDTSLTSQVPLIASNPVAIAARVEGEGSLVFVFMQSTDGQLSALLQSPTKATEFEHQILATKLPANLPPSNQSHDPIQVVSLRNYTYVFVRTLTNTSEVYWNRFKGRLDFGNRTWSRLGDTNDHLKFDPCVGVNTFLERIEIFGVFESGHVMHTWQDGPDSFYGNWKKLGGPFSPKFDSVPVVHQMGHSDFNGVLNLFVRGVDSAMHHISQTTCDKVKNAWGPCTWTTFHKVGGQPPSDGSLGNPFTTIHSIHRGIEIFTVGEASGHLFHVWQRERDSSYSDWEDLGLLPDSSPFLSSPALLIDHFGWWEAFALDPTRTVKRFVEKPLKFSLSANKVTYDKNVTVTWAIPKDQATHMDWIGVYPNGAPGHGYVDYSYVGGSQNPLKDPVPEGSLQFRNTLPNGTYNYRYMVNKAYDAVFEDSVVVSGAPQMDDWVSLYEGLARGLGGFNTNVTKCAYDGEHTLDSFKASFDAFEERKIFEGLHLFSEGLSDFRDALIQCNETDIVKILTRFIEDLVSCTEDDCVKFLIDIGLELVILYEHIYEIYGDIQGATNSFKVKAYEQGGICVGRVTNACLIIE